MMNNNIFFHSMRYGTPIEAQCLSFNEQENYYTVGVEGKTGIIPAEEFSIYDSKEVNMRLLHTVIKAVVTKYDGKDQLVLSRKKVMQKKVAEFVRKGPVNVIISNAKVVSASSTALYLDIGDGLSGVMYRKEIISSPYSNPTDVFPIGTRIPVKIIKYTPEKEFFTCSHRALFQNNRADYKRGQIVTGIIRQEIVVNDIVTGYFVQVTPAISGILDIPEGTIFNNGDTFEMIINSVTVKGLKLRMLKEKAV